MDLWRWVSVIILGASSLSAAAMAQDRATVVEVVGGSHHDFGRIKESDGDVVHAFEVVNPGTAAVTITAVETSCGCVRADVASRRVEPGATVELVATFLPSFRQGDFRRKMVRLRFADGAPLEVFVSAWVIPRLGVAPRETSFGDVGRGEVGAARRVTLTSRVPGLEIVGCELQPGAPFSWRPLGREEATEDGDVVTRHLFEASFTGSERVGVHRARVVIRTSDRRLASLSHALEATVVGMVRVEPERVYVRMTAGQAVRFHVDLTPTDPAHRFAVVGTELLAPASMALVAARHDHPRDMNGHRLVMTGMAPRVHEGGALGYLRIKTDAPGQEVIEVPISGLLDGGSGPAPSSASSVLRSTESRHDFGRIREEDGIVRYAFSLVNAGDRPIDVTDVTSSCSCVTAALRETRIAAGASVALEVALDPTGRQGPLGDKSVVITTDVPGQPRVEVIVAADIFPRVGFDPVAVAFGEVPVGAAAAGPVPVTLVSSVPGFRVEAVELPEDSPFTWTALGTEAAEMAGEPVVRYRFAVDFKGDDRIGRLRALAQITTNDERRPVIPYPLSVDVVGPLRVEPDRFHLRLAPGDPIARTITITRRADSRSFRVLAVEVDAPEDLALRTSSEQDGDGYRLHLRGVTPKSVGRRGSPLATIRILTDVPGQETIVVPVRVVLGKGAR